VMQKYSNVVSIFKRDVLGAYEPSFRLHDLLLSVSLGLRFARVGHGIDKRAMLQKKSRLFDLIKQTNDTQVQTLLQLLDAVTLNRDYTKKWNENNFKTLKTD